MSDYEKKSQRSNQGLLLAEENRRCVYLRRTCVPCSETIRVGQCETLIELFNKEQKGGETDDR